LSPDADLEGLLDGDRIDLSLFTVGSDARDVIAANDHAIVGHAMRVQVETCPREIRMRVQVETCPRDFALFTARGYALAIPRKRALAG
jgi:hypothetical protein